jgi:hypothetical protein
VILAPHPGRIAHVVPVDLPWPRTAETRLTSAYEEQVARVSRLLRSVQAAAGMRKAVRNEAASLARFNSIVVLACLLGMWQLAVLLLHVPVHAAGPAGGGRCV